MLIRFLCSFCLLVCLKSIQIEAQAADYVDPEMLHFSNQGRYSHTDKTSLENCHNELAACKDQMMSEIGSNDQRSSHDIVLNQMKNIVANWMFVSGFQDFHLPPGDKKTVSLTLTLAETDLTSLNKFLNNPSYGNFMNTVPILNRLFTINNAWKSYFRVNLEPPKKDWVNIIFNIIMSCFNKEFLLVSSALIMGIFLLKALIFGTELRIVAVFFLVAVFFSGFLWNWCHMYQKAVVDQTVKRIKYDSYAYSCKPDSSFFGFVKWFFGYSAPIDECTEYYRSREIDPIVLVPPTLALSETISMFLIHPSILLAEAMQKITTILFGNMIYGSLIGTPIVMIVFGTIFTFLFITICGQRIKLKLAYIGSIEIGGFPFHAYSHRPIENEIPAHNASASLAYKANVIQSSQASGSSSENGDAQSCTTCGNDVTVSSGPYSTSKIQTSRSFSSVACSSSQESGCSARTTVQTPTRSNKSWLKDLGDMKLTTPKKRKPLRDFNSQNSKRPFESENISNEDVPFIRYRHRKMSF